MSLIECPKCKASIDSSAKFCPECGAKILIECPQCGEQNNVTASFCHNCGSKLQLNDSTATKTDIDANVNESVSVENDTSYVENNNEKKHRNKTIVVVLLTAVALGIAALVFLLTHHSSEYWLGVSELKENMKRQEAIDALKDYEMGLDFSSSVQYEEYPFTINGNVYEGKLTLVFDDDKPKAEQTVENVSFSYPQNSNEYFDLKYDITQELGKPMFQQNMNDGTLDKVYTIWENPKVPNSYLYLLDWKSTASDASYYIDYVVVDNDQIQDAKKTMASINGDQKKSKQFDEIKQLCEMDGKPITEAIDQFSITSQKLIGSSIVDFYTDGTFLGKKGTYSFYCDNPNKFDPLVGKYIGEITSVKFVPNKESDIEDITLIFDDLFGDLTGEKTNTWDAIYPCSVSVNNDEISLNKSTNNPETHVLFPDVYYSESEEEIPGYSNVSSSVFDLSDDSTVEQVTEKALIRDAYEAAKDAVKRQLKSPSSATFAPVSDVVMVREGSVYILRSTVEAANSFGANISKSFIVGLEYSSKTFTVQYCEFED